MKLRNEILRPGMDVSECRFEGDDAPETRHFAVVDEGNDIVGIVSVYRNGNPTINSADAWQIRGMATSSTCRGRGVGNLLLTSAEDYAKSRGATLIWANARSEAAGFYTKSGYSLASEEFFISGVGAHFLVVKSLV
ncbi:MAG: GNAT family N-acetyltransferase [Opitutales bacterium]|nr:GNAT family N-acetyltransferase [Opitutales bacterium]